MIRCLDVQRRYGSPDHPVAALNGVSLEIDTGSFVAITGPSGSGKSTLLNLIGSLDQPDGGEIHVADLALHAASEAEKTRYRRHDLGVIFQFFNLMPTMTVEENVMLPLLLRGDSRANSLPAAREMLDLVGLSNRRTHRSGELSGGEMQRVAIARALAHRPKLIIADEPTGNLDSKNRDRVLDILGSVHRQQLATLVVVTHEEEVASAAGRRIEMADGRLVRA